MAKTRRRRNVHRRRTKKHRRRHRTKRRVKRRRKTTRKQRGRGLGPSKMAKLGVTALATSTAMGQGMGYGISPSMGTAAAVKHFNTVACADFHISDLARHHSDHGPSFEHAAAVTKAALGKKRSCKRRGKPMRNPNTGKPMSKKKQKQAEKRIRAQEKAAKAEAEQAIKAKAAKAEQATKREEALKKIEDDLKVLMEAHEKKIEKIEKKEEADKLAAKLEEQAEKTKTSKAKEAAEAAKAAKAEAEQSKAAKAEAEQQQEIEEEVVREMKSERNEGSKGMGGAEMAAYGAAATAAGLVTHGMLRGRQRARTTRIVTRDNGSRFLERINDGRNVRELTPERR